MRALVHGDLVGFRPARQCQIAQRCGELDFDGGVGQRLFLNLARRADGDDAAFIDDGHAVAELLGFFDVVGGQQDGALLAAQVQDEFVDFEAGLGVESGGGLVEEEDLRIVEHGERQGQALLLPAGEFGVLRVALLPELEALQELIAIHGAGVEGGEELHGLADFELLLEVGGLQADADAVFELKGLDLGVAAEHADAAAGTGAQALEDFDGGGFAGAVGAEQAEDFAGADFEIDAFDGRKAAVALGEGFHLNGIVHELTSFSQAGRRDRSSQTGHSCPALLRRDLLKTNELIKISNELIEIGRTFMSGLAHFSTRSREERMACLPFCLYFIRQDVKSRLSKRANFKVSDLLPVR